MDWERKKINLQLNCLFFLIEREKGRKNFVGGLIISYMSFLSFSQQWRVSFYIQRQKNTIIYINFHFLFEVFIYIYIYFFLILGFFYLSFFSFSFFSNQPKNISFLFLFFNIITFLLFIFFPKPNIARISEKTTISKS